MNPIPHILVIDDDPSVTAWLSAALAADQFDVEVAHSGEEGLRRIREHPPRAVILDALMPSKDGWETCRAIRLFSGVPILALSPLTDPASVASLLDAGADDCLAKPVAGHVLIAHLRRLMRRGPRSPARDNPDWHPSTRPLPS